MNVRTLTILLLYICLANNGYGQSLKAWLSAADTAFAHKDYYSAFKYYEVALEYDSTRVDVWYHFAESAREFTAFPYAERAYAKVVNTPNHSFPMAYYWLAETKFQLGKYDEAADYYEMFLEDKPKSGEKYFEKATKKLEDSHWAVDILSRPNNITINPLDTGINSPYSDFGALFLDDTLYYSSFQFVDKKDDYNPHRTYIKVLASTDGTEGVFVDIPVEEKGKHIAHTTFSRDRSKMYYTLCEYEEDDLNKIRCDIYSSQRMGDGSWGLPEKLSINQAGSTSTQPNIAYLEAAREEWLFFTSDRKDGAGGLDIWYSKIDDYGNFSTPENLTDINTAYNEATPFFHELTQKLYFSTKGYSSLGGYDIYQSRLVANTWTPAKHLGTPLNSSYDDLYYNLNNNGSVIHFSSNRPGSIFLEADKEACCNDIFRVEVDINMELEALTFNQQDELPLAGATVYLYQLVDGEEKLIDSLVNFSGNNFNFPLQKYQIYTIKSKREGFSPTGIKLDLTDDDYNGVSVIQRDLFLDPLPIQLQILTVEAADQQPLEGCRVELRPMDGGNFNPNVQTNEFGNDFFFPLALERPYEIVATKPGFDGRIDTIRFSLPDLDRLGGKVTLTVPLDRVSFDDFLPLALYFDNDRPNPRSRRTTTEKEYGETYEAYYDKKQEFINEYTLDLSDNDKFLTEQLYEQFFEREVRGGNSDLVAFSDKLLGYLEKGNSLEIELRGYASPRASSDYNKILSKRRVHCLRNFFDRYKDGIFRRFLGSGALVINVQAFGEEEADEAISDKLEDKKNSVYSILASVERRVEIREVKTNIQED